MSEAMDAGPAATAVPDDAPHLLVVDDDKRIRDLLGRFLSENGFRVTDRRGCRRRARLDARPRLRPARRRRDDAGRNGPRIRARAAHPFADPDPDADRAHRGRTASPGSRSAPTTIWQSRSSRASCCCGSTTSSIAARGRRRPAGDRLRPLHLPSGARRAERDGEAISSPTRARPPAHFAARPARRSTARTSPTSPAGGERAVDVQINRLRRKIEADPANPVYLQTVRGRGYLFYVD